jgi:hypothetical protein
VGVLVLVAYAGFVVALIAVAKGPMTVLALAGPAVLVVAWAVLMLAMPRRSGVGAAGGSRALARDAGSAQR